MNLLLREQMTFVAIRRLMKAILGDRKRGQPPSAGDTRVDPVRVLSGSGGLDACFPNPVVWQQLYMLGMDVCPYVDAFWQASNDVGLTNAFGTFVGFDEERGCLLPLNKSSSSLVSVSISTGPIPTSQLLTNISTYVIGLLSKALIRLRSFLEWVASLCSGLFSWRRPRTSWV